MMSTWFRVRQPLPRRARILLGCLSFLLPLGLWCLVSYVPAVWHSQVQITDAGSASYLQPDMFMARADFDSEVADARAQHRPPPRGIAANPIYLPAPGAVAEAFVTAFRTPPPEQDGKWLHQEIWHSVQIIFWGFVISSIFGVPLGILCGAYNPVARLCEPFIEFFRYLPAPAFGALAVAMLGIYDGPKIAIVVIGTFFQQVLIIANTTRRIDHALLEAALTLGARNRQLLGHVILPAILPELYRDQRILLGWAWTYLIVAELIGTLSGITWFITQQARYLHFANVYAAIIMIGILGFGTDLLLGALGRKLFPWDRSQEREAAT